MYTLNNIDDDISVGAIIDGRYQVLGKLGSGIFTEVYLAENSQTKKKWAIKVICKQGKTYEQFAGRLSVEIGILNKLSHPALPTIADIVQTDQKLLVIMDYIEGVSLSQIISERGAQSEELVIEWAKQLCDALGYLHSQTPAIIHNDIHPRNMLLKPNGQITLIDFGTAYEYGPNNNVDTTCLGTTFYAAPEKFGGVIDNRTDIYALGMTIYSLITGKDPSEPPYAIYPIRKINSNLSYGLEYIIGKCTARDPKARYQNTKEILFDLNNISKLSSRLKKRSYIRRLFSK